MHICQTNPSLIEHRILTVYEYQKPEIELIVMIMMITTTIREIYNPREVEGTPIAVSGLRLNTHTPKKRYQKSITYLLKEQLTIKRTKD
jgi:hypothetical protein